MKNQIFFFGKSKIIQLINSCEVLKVSPTIKIKEY